MHVRHNNIFVIVTQVSAQCAQLRTAAKEANTFADDNRQLREQLDKKIAELGLVLLMLMAYFCCGLYGYGLYDYGLQRYCVYDCCLCSHGL